MAASQVVPALDPCERGRAQRGDARPGATFDELEFVGPEPAFTDCVVPALRASREALDDVMLGEQSPKVGRYVLRAAVGVKPKSV